MVYVLPTGSHDLRFPPLEVATPDGLLAVGGDLSRERLLVAYRAGIFPWYSDGQPILWWSPDPRTVLFPERLRISRSLAKTLRQVRFRVTADTRFRQVIQACAAPRGDRLDSGTWITAEMIEAYCDLHEYGVAHSIESWLDDKMVGGLYGIALGRVFFGESMFSTESNASKVAFVHLVRHLQKWGYHMIDCQMPSGHLSRFGAEAIGRAEFTQRLAQGLAFADELDCWKLDSEIDLNP